MVRVSYLKEDKVEKNGNGKPKDPVVKKDIITVSLPLDPNDDIPFEPTFRETEPKPIFDKKYRLDKADIQTAILACQSHITRYSESKRANSPQNQLIWEQVVELQKKLKEMIR